jgi:hypothetical protein
MIFGSFAADSNECLPLRFPSLPFRWPADKLLKRGGELAIIEAGGGRSRRRDCR